MIVLNQGPFDGKNVNPETKGNCSFVVMRGKRRFHAFYKDGKFSHYEEDMEVKAALDSKTEIVKKKGEAETKGDDKESPSGPTAETVSAEFSEPMESEEVPK